MRHLLLLAAVCLLSSGPTALAQPVDQPFSFETIRNPIPNVYHGTQSWGDVDADGDLDILLSGRQNNGDLVAGIWLNESLGEPDTLAFMLAEIDVFPVVYASSAWTDIDGDGDLDAILSGSASRLHPYEPVTRIYRNDGNGSFSEHTGGLEDLYGGSIDVADVDSDGDQDLLMTGIDETGNAVTLIAENDGTGGFTSSTVGITGVAFGEAKFGDVDSDGDLDVVVSGLAGEQFTTQLFENQDGSFTDTGVALPGLAFSSVEWVDYDGDDDPDLIVTGGRLSTFIFDGSVQVYRNDAGSLTEVDLGLDGVLGGDIAWGDYDNDGDLDVFVIGSQRVLDVEYTFGRRIARFIENDGAGEFGNGGFLVGSIHSEVDWGDVDGDGDLDLITTGLTAFGPTVTFSPGVTHIYANRRLVVPPPPADPSLKTATVDGGNVLLEWDSSPAAGDFTYNVRVGSAPGKTDVLPSLSDPASGRRLLSRPGNASSKTSLRLRDLEPGTYYWSVQTIDNAFVPSGFSSERSFTIGTGTAVDTDPSVPATFAVRSNYPNPFSDRTSIQFETPRAGQVQLRIFDTLGHRIAEVDSEVEGPGTFQVDWNGLGMSGAPAASGVYFYELRSESDVRTGSMILIR